jgi:hypothetical protein
MLIQTVKTKENTMSNEMNNLCTLSDKILAQAGKAALLDNLLSGAPDNSDPLMVTGLSDLASSLRSGLEELNHFMLELVYAANTMDQETAE